MKRLLKMVGVVLAVVAVIFIEIAAIKVFCTSCNLLILRDNAQYLSGLERTDEIAEEMIKNQTDRALMYKSKDIVVRTFVNLDLWLKFTIAVLAVIWLVCLPFWIYFVIKHIKSQKRQKELELFRENHRKRMDQIEAECLAEEYNLLHN